MEISELLSLGPLLRQHVYICNMEIHFLGMDLLVLQLEFTLQCLPSHNKWGVAVFFTRNTMWSLVSRGHQGVKLSFPFLGVLLASACYCSKTVWLSVYLDIQLFSIWGTVIIETDNLCPGLVISVQLFSWPEHPRSSACCNTPVQSTCLFSCWLTLFHWSLV